MSGLQTVILTFKDRSSYEACKKKVTEGRGTIKDDFGTTLLGFTAVVSPALAASIQSSSLADNGILSMEHDTVVTTQ